MTKDNNQCSQCQGEFTKGGNGYIWWVEEGKEEIRYCCACKNKKEQGQGSGHRSSMKPMTSSDPGIGFMDICGFCWQDLNAKNPPQQPHEYKDGKFTVKHDCQGKCKGYIGCFGLHEKCEKSNTWKWTQKNINLLWDKIYKRGMCPDCRINSLAWDANVSGDEEAKKTLAEVKKLIGKDNSSPPPPPFSLQRWNLELFQGTQHQIYQIRGW